MARLVLFLAVLVALATQMIVLADGVDDSDVDVFTVNSNDETLSVTTTLDVKGDTYIFAAYAVNNTANDPLLAGANFTITFIPDDGDAEVVDSESFDGTEDAGITKEFAYAGYCSLNTTGVVNITWTFAAPEAPAGNDTGNSTETKVLADEVITASIYTGFVEGSLKADGDVDVPLVGHGVTLPLTLSNSTALNITLSTDDDDPVLASIFQTVLIVEDCPVDPLNPTINMNTVTIDLLANHTQFEQLNLTAGEYYFVFQSNATLDSLDEDVEIEVDISTAVQQASVSTLSSSSSSSGFLGLPNWAWYTIIGGVAVVLVLVLLGAIAGVFVVRRRSKYEAI